MTDLLTTRQIQEILKVDRITIYRMLQDGRLKGVKVGSQWRFSPQEVERLLSGEQVEDSAPADSSGSVFPVHCVQTIQNLFSGVSLMGALVVDTAGNPVTQISAPAKISALIAATETGRVEISDSFRTFAAQPGGMYVSPIGLRSAVAPITDNGMPMGWFMVGQVFTPSDGVRPGSGLADRYQLDPAQVDACLAEVTVVTPGQWAQMEGWAVSAAQAVQSILHERTGFMLRLQKIANLTQV